MLTPCAAGHTGLSSGHCGVVCATSPVSPSGTGPTLSQTITVIGRGRLGTALPRARGAGPPQGRGSDGARADVVLLCVPDAEIATAAAAVAPGPLVGHCSGATTLAPLAPHEA